MMPKTESTEELLVTFVVTVPSVTTPNGPVCITGNHRRLTNWGEGIPLTQVGASEYQASIPVKKGFNLEFKFTRGSWETVEKDCQYFEIPNRSLHVKKGGVYRFQIENWSDLGNKPAKKHTWVGSIKEHRNFPAKELHNSRNIWVYLPPSYDTNPKQYYPVLYAHDGNNVFDRSTAFLGVEWELDDTADLLIREHKMQEIIIVAIQNTTQRQAEYTPVYMPHLGGGKADLYADFIIREVKPFIDKNYRTLRDSQYTAIMGSSLGGLVSLYMAWKHHDVFSMAGVVSPSVWWADREILRYLKKTQQKPPIKIWLDIGTLEGQRTDTESGVTYAVKDVRELRNLLLSKGFRMHFDLEYMEAEGAKHNEAAWAQRVDKILLFFFGGQRTLSRKLWKF